jgi:alanine racemase
MTDPAAPIEERLRAAGLPPLPRTAWLQVDLGRLAGNVRAIRAALPPGALFEAVVKANGYGHGAVPVAHAALAAGAHGLCVATLDEALELRAAGLDAPILVLFPIPPDGFGEAARAGIAVAAGDDLLWARGLAAYARSRRRARGHLGDLVVHVGLETGLGRDGLRPDQAIVAVRGLAGVPGARLEGVWSHLQAPEDTARTARQVDRFRAAVRAMVAAGLPVPHRHLLASGGLLGVERFVAGTAPVFDGVRVGLSLYGIEPEGLRIGRAASAISAALRPILSLHARPVRVAELPAGEGVGYGPSFVTARPSRIATLPVGYADGWVRALGNRATALVRGSRVPLVGTVAMDAVMADVTDVTGPPITPDDEFVLLGEQGAGRITAGELARERATISWEVLATMAARLPRVYTSPADAVGIRTLTQDRGPWRTSRSGTATSATSRWTRS